MDKTILLYLIPLVILLLINVIGFVKYCTLEEHINNLFEASTIQGYDVEDLKARIKIIKTERYRPTSDYNFKLYPAYFQNFGADKKDFKYIEGILDINEKSISNLSDRVGRLEENIAKLNES